MNKKPKRILVCVVLDDNEWKDRFSLLQRIGFRIIEFLFPFFLCFDIKKINKEKPEMEEKK